VRPASRVSGRAGTTRRREVQALRALAVALVVLYHLSPATVPGGFVGVDVFFAISGFLITWMLLREIERSETLSLTGFWARRARRILPAALLTLLASAVATVVFVPMTSWGRFFDELRASAAYVQNWHLAGTAVDYFAADDPPSIAQHFWTLSIEEQFYLVWPVVLLGAVTVTRRRPARVRRRAIAVAMAALTAVSLGYSLHDTAANPAAAYFATPTRAWEFGAGGLLALVWRPDRQPARGAAVLSWLGLAAIVVAALSYDDATAFPGTAALLPVAGAIAVMWAGAPAQRWAPTPILGLAPVQTLGDISYSVYLWHWPLLILAPFVLDHPVGTHTAIAVGLLTLLAAWLTKRLVEDPVRFAPLLARRPPGWTLGLAGAATALVVAVTVSGTSYVEARIRADEHATRQTLASHPRCFGAAARDPLRRPCHNPRLARAVAPTPIEAPKLDNAPCTMVERHSRLQVCAFGAAPSTARATVAVVGDSHASHWRPALSAVAKAEHWRALSLTRTGCPFSEAIPAVREPARSHCTQWNRQVREWFARHPEVTTVFATAHAGAAVVGGPGEDQFAAQRDGYARALSELPRSVRHTIVIRDTPTMRGATLACVQDALDKDVPAGPACAVARTRALRRDPAVAAASTRTPRLAHIDLTRTFCDARRCYPVIGGALVYKDEDHLTPTFAATLAPLLHRAVDRALGGRTRARAAARP
jgi:peptidoglycan/LPS O-acetylase OafA/YrhL